MWEKSLGLFILTHSENTSRDHLGVGRGQISLPGSRDSGILTGRTDRRPLRGQNRACEAHVPCCRRVAQTAADAAPHPYGAKEPRGTADGRRCDNPRACARGANVRAERAAPGWAPTYRRGPRAQRVTSTFLSPAGGGSPGIRSPAGVGVLQGPRGFLPKLPEKLKEARWFRLGAFSPGRSPAGGSLSRGFAGEQKREDDTPPPPLCQRQPACPRTWVCSMPCRGPTG